jgi:hypothetical protein
MKILTFTFYLFAFGYSGELFAQFSGRVLDVNQQPIQDVMILNQRTKDHTHTDANGYFTNKTSMSGDTIRFSYLGYKTLQTILDEKEGMQDQIITLEESALLLEQVNISEPLHRNLQQIDLKINPVQNSQELLKKVPGLFIAQHAGGGKAEQIFLRGFDIDHGTDIAISVDNLLPLNMVSHAHGQGYADLHFIIPETVKNIDFEKGSYNAARGNFATAAYVNFVLQDKIQSNSLIFETGKFQTNRIAGLFKLNDSEKSNSYFAGEYVSSDGYFEHPQDFSKYNALLKYNYNFNAYSGLKCTGSFFTSRWNASGQVPQRAIDAGTINRFGAIDPNEGGETGRSNVMIQYFLSKKAHQLFKVTGFYSNYNFVLYSNFTFFLNDSINGDQIKQKENRNIYGLETSWTNHFNNLEWNFAVGARIDDVNDSELSHTKNRNILLERKSLGDINEQNVYSYLKLNWFTQKLDIDLQARADYFNVSYRNKLASDPLIHHSEFLVSPKFNAYYNFNESIQVYAKTGLGFHSNDTRLLNQSPDEDLLIRSFSADLGFQFKIGDHSLIHFGAWYIDLEDELVYVGDEAVVESSGHTQRNGLEAGWRWLPFSWFSLDAEGSYTIAKTVDDPEGQNYVPLAAKWNSSGGISIHNIKNFSIGLRYRYLGDRPANEDYSIIAKGYQLIDGNINYKYKNFNFSFIAENILNQEWNEAQFATLSRLQYESVPVEEIHFTPGAPFNFRMKVQVMF